jgi:peptidoglycan/LPS O-acetylase OafA/YrhL
VPNQLNQTGCVAGGPVVRVRASSRSAEFSSHHIAGLDTLRFVCAMWVALHHGADPHVAVWLGLSPVFKDWNAITFDGVAAVIVFFVISGLCVHYPYARSSSCNLPAFYAQRFLRVGMPLLVIIAFKLAVPMLGAVQLANAISSALRTVIWSLWCELIYYALYPALLIGFRRIGMIPIFAASCVAASVTIFDHWHFMTYWQYSKTLAWITALPAWLLGCALAQAIAADRLPVLPGSIWTWRVSALLLSIPAKALVYADLSPVLIGNPATLGLYAIFAYFWVSKEVQFYQSHRPAATLEWGGRWSYSIYLVHNIVLVFFTRHFLHPYAFALWPTEIAAVLTLSYVFYRFVEYPSHRLARALSGLIARQQVIPGLRVSVGVGQGFDLR